MMELESDGLKATERIDAIKVYVAKIIELLNLDLSDPQLQETPQRIAKMYVNELFRGLYEEPPEVKLFPAKTNSVVTVEVPFTSTCAHHFLPFYGTVTIIYEPKEFVAGLSKFNRIVKHFSAKPQLQETLTQEICDYLSNKINPEWMIVKVEATHTCVTARGVKDVGSKTTTESRYRSLVFATKELSELSYTTSPEDVTRDVLEKMKQVK